MRIANTYEAYWFLAEHQKFKCRESDLVPEGTKAEKGQCIRRVRDEYRDHPDYKLATYLIREWKALDRQAIIENLDICYMKVDDHGKVNKDASKNSNIECWLEFGKIAYVVRAGELHLEHWHDIKLDVGAPTFDEAL